MLTYSHIFGHGRDFQAKFIHTFFSEINGNLELGIKDCRFRFEFCISVFRICKLSRRVRGQQKSSQRLPRQLTPSSTQGVMYRILYFRILCRFVFLISGLYQKCGVVRRLMRWPRAELPTREFQTSIYSHLAYNNLCLLQNTVQVQLEMCSMGQSLSSPPASFPTPSPPTIST